MYNGGHSDLLSQVQQESHKHRDWDKPVRSVHLQQGDWNITDDNILPRRWLQAESPWEKGQWSHDQVASPRVWKYIWGWVREDVSEPRQGSWLSSNELRLNCSWSIEDQNDELHWRYHYRLRQGRSEKEGHKVKRRSQQTFYDKLGLQEIGSG